MKIIHPLQTAVLVVLICSSIRAAVGPALLQLRAKLPVSGDVLIDHEDPSTLIGAAAEGSTSEIVSVEPTGAMPMDKALRMRVTRAYETPYRVQVLSEKSRAEVHKG